MNFPVYIGGVNTQAVQSAMVDFSPLTKTFMMYSNQRNKAAKAKAASSKGSSKYDIKGTVGESMAIEAALAKEQGIIAKNLSIYGAENASFVANLPDVKAANSRMSEILSPGMLNSTERRGDQVNKYGEHIEKSGQQFDIRNLVVAGGIRTYSDRYDLLENSPSVRDVVGSRDLKHSTMGAEDAWKAINEQLNLAGWQKNEWGGNAQEFSDFAVNEIKGVAGVSGSVTSIPGKKQSSNKSQLAGAMKALMIGGDIQHGLHQGFIQNALMTGKFDKTGAEAIVDARGRPNDRYYDELGKYINKTITGFRDSKKQYYEEDFYKKSGIVSWKPLEKDQLKAKATVDGLESFFSSVNNTLASDFAQPTNVYMDALALSSEEEGYLKINRAIKATVPDGDLKNYQFSKGSPEQFRMLMNRLSENYADKFNLALQDEGLPPFAKAFTKAGSSNMAYLNQNSNTGKASAAGNAAMAEIVEDNLAIKMGVPRSTAGIEQINVGGLWFSGESLGADVELVAKPQFRMNVTAGRFTNGILENGSIQSIKEAEKDMKWRKNLSEQLASNDQAYDNDVATRLVTGANTHAGVAELWFSEESLKKLMERNEFYLPRDFAGKKYDYNLVSLEDAKNQLEEWGAKLVNRGTYKGATPRYVFSSGKSMTYADAIRTAKAQVLDLREGPKDSIGRQVGWLDKRRMKEAKGAIKINGGELEISEEILTLMPEIRAVQYKDEAGNIKTKYGVAGMYSTSSMYKSPIGQKAFEKEFQAKAKDAPVIWRN